MLPWLDRKSVTEILGELPESFPVETKLQPLVNLLEIGWLTDLVGKETVRELKQVLTERGELTQLQTDWLALIRPFLTLASWADYVLNSNVITTKTGQREKRSDLSDAIDPDQRAALHRSYYAKAKEWAVRISTFRAKLQTAPCTTKTVGSHRRSVSVVRAKGSSYFNGDLKDCCNE